jgi:MFS family permease
MKCAYYEQGKCVPEYSKEFTSIVTEWNLICSRAYYSNLSQSGLFTGLLIGGFLFGTLSDTYGRKKTYFLSLLGATICHVFSGLTSTFSIYFLARILLGVFCSGFIIIGYTILLEVVSTSKRSEVGMAVHVFVPFGYVVVALTAYYIREWRTFTVLSGFLGGVFLSTWRMTPESPRWLLTQGREEEAVATLDWIARGNGSKMPDCKLQNAVHVGRQSAGRSVSVLDLLRGNAIRHRTIVLAMAWFTNCTVYYALSLNASALVRGRYLPTVLFGLIELPAYCASYILITRLGRRSGHVFFLVLSGVCCLAWSLADSSGMSASTKTVLALLGKMAIAGSFGVLYFYSAELFPTQVR